MMKGSECSPLRPSMEDSGGDTLQRGAAGRAGGGAGRVGGGGGGCLSGGRSGGGRRVGVGRGMLNKCDTIPCAMVVQHMTHALTGGSASQAKLAQLAV